jgi:superfamily I DNA/RNA helicase
VNLTNLQMASLALTTVRRFTHSRESSFEHIRLPKCGVLTAINRAAEREIMAAVHRVADAVWKKMCDPASSFPLGHDGYLKYWALRRQKLDFAYILLDEAQDTNDVVLELLEHQKAQVVYVGDRHQQIYQWRGAINALDKVRTPLSCALTQSFRFGPRIAELANVVLGRLGERNIIVGNDAVCSEVGIVPQPDVIIARSNGTVLQAVMTCLDDGGTPYVEGGTGELRRLVRGVYQLRKQGFSTVPEFFGFHSWEEVVEHSETEHGQDLAGFVRLIQAYGPGTLWRLIECVADERDGADVTISTTHKAKGREWDVVRLEDDFVLAETDDEGNPTQLPSEEMRILYVALTRAKSRLQVGEQTLRFLDA